LSPIHPLTTRPAPLCSVSITSLPICVRMFYLPYYVVAVLIHIESVCSQTCAYTGYTHSSQYRDAGRAEGINKLGQHWYCMPVCHRFTSTYLGVNGVMVDCSFRGMLATKAVYNIVVKCACILRCILYFRVHLISWLCFKFASVVHCINAEFLLWEFAPVTIIVFWSDDFYS
jgi:hypothetical protein